MKPGVLEIGLEARSRHTKGRILRLNTAHGMVRTPAFMPVGTKAAVSAILPDELLAAGTQMILGGNTYHMIKEPGLASIEAAGGMHRFMGWSGPMLTDSGGYQVFSLSKNSEICRIDESGANFRFPGSSDWIRLTPASSIQAQKIIGADIVMAFDQCTPDSYDHRQAKAAMDRTHRWLLESLEEHQRNRSSRYGRRQAFFGIVQGGTIRSLREESAAFMTSLDLDGIAIGGETIGFDMPKTVEILGWLEPMIPRNTVRYAMGVGSKPQDLLDVIAEGVDIFDCVAPTRNARHGAVYAGRFTRAGGWPVFEGEGPTGRLNLKRKEYQADDRPIMESCLCYTCRRYSRSYLHFLLRENDLWYFNLATIHNVAVMHQACREAQTCIEAEAAN